MTDETTAMERLLKVLGLGDPSEDRGHTYIQGEALYFPTGRVYGGQVIAQSVVAASKTVSPTRLPHSIHGYFIKAGGRIPSTAISSRPATSIRICCSTWNRCATAVRSRHAGSM